MSKTIEKNDITIGIGARIRAIRKSAGMTQEELGNRTGYSRTAVVKLEGGEIDLPTSKLLAVSKALNVSPLYILYGKEE